MLENYLGVSLFLLCAILLYRFHPAILRVLKRFDDTNRDRIESEIRDRRDGIAHFRHTLSLAEEQVEQIGTITVPDPRTAMPLTRYLFEGEQFASEREARRAREEKVRALARQFYMDLPAALRARKEDEKLGKG